MIPLRPALADYLAMRRAVGYKLLRTEKLLVQFIGFLEGAAVDRITTDLAMSWAGQPASADVSWRAGRLSVVRGFARYLHTLDAATEVPRLASCPRARTGRFPTCTPTTTSTLW